MQIRFVIALWMTCCLNIHGWAQEPANRAEEPANRAEEPANRAEEPANRAEEPANRAEEPANRAQEPANRAQEPANVTLAPQGQKLLTYNVSYLDSPDPKQPWFGRSGFIHPMFTPAGKVVTEGFPEDHLHQHALMFAWVSANFDGHDVDFWNSKKQKGYIEHTKIVRSDVSSLVVTLQHVDTTNKPPKVVLNETWEMTAVPHDTMNVFDLKSTQTCATDQPLIIKKYHYGGMCVRGHKSWSLENVTMQTSEGKYRVEGNHTRPSYVLLHGDVDGQACGIVAMSHPKNFRSPQPVRLHPKMPYFCFAPMVLGKFQIKPEKPYVSRFRFVAFDGEPDQDAINEIWKQYQSGS